MSLTGRLFFCDGDMQYMRSIQVPKVTWGVSRCRPQIYCSDCLQEKQKASERHIEELSEKVQSLELEKKQLQAALEKASLVAKVLLHEHQMLTACNMRPKFHLMPLVMGSGSAVRDSL